MKVYTKTGDKGQTSLVGGKRVSKCCNRLESYGTIDELNSHIGLLASHCTNTADRQFLTNVQNTLFVVGSYLATDPETKQSYTPDCVTTDMVEQVEHEIDRLQELLPALRSFILPAGTMAASQAHVCRTICRRAERCILRLEEECNTPIDTTLLSYINRLSDYLFVLARKLNLDAGVEDVAWRK